MAKIYTIGHSNRSLPEFLGLLSELGGYRRQGLGKESPNAAWRAGGFRNYADHMLTREFREGIEQLFRVAKEKRTAIMCAERFWWRCHRRLISDFLVARGHRVVHILGPHRAVGHRLPPFARVVEGRMIYPAEAGLLGEDNMWGHATG